MRPIFGRFTHPHAWQTLFKNLPHDLHSIQEIAHNLLIHPWDHVIAQRMIPPHREHEKNLRSVPDIMDACMAHNDASLSRPRRLSERLMVSCRHYSVLICSILMSQGVPARCRYAFNGHIWPAFHHDQIIVEYWCPALRRWCRMDPRTRQEDLHEKTQLRDIDVTDLPSFACPLAAEVWQACRRGRVDPNRFGAGLSRQFHGMTYIRNALIHDLAMLNHQESLPWDVWGEMHAPLNKKYYAKADALAKSLLADDPELLKKLFQQKAYHLLLKNDAIRPH